MDGQNLCYKIFKKGRFFLVALSFLVFYERGFAEQREMGVSSILQHSSCSFDGTYTVGEDYDISPYLKEVKASMEHPFLLKVTISPNHLEAGTYLSLTFFDPSDKQHAPVVDLSHPGTDKQTEEASFVQLKAYERAGGHLALAPIVYKKGFRGVQGGKEQYFNPFATEDALFDAKEHAIGGPGNLFSTLFIKVAGRGSYKATDTEDMILPDDKGEYTFFIHLNPALPKKIFFITAITKVAMLPSGRGLRSPIIGPPLNISSSCR